jgi:hypothetical protein
LDTSDSTYSPIGPNGTAGIAVGTSGIVYAVDGFDDVVFGGIPVSEAAIAEQPSSQTTTMGGTVVFTTLASLPADATYQWMFFGVNVVAFPAVSLIDGNGIAGSTGPQLMITGATAAEAGTYFCVVTTAGVPTWTSFAYLQVSSTSTPGSLMSISSRGFVGTGDDILIGGFYITGGTSVTVLVQALGPALSASPYNVSGAMQHPALSIHQSQNGQDVVLYSNAGWESNQVLLNAATAVGAQPALQPGWADSELLVTLPPGGYTAEVTGADGGTGVALCAVYQLP